MGIYDDLTDGMRHFDAIEELKRLKQSRKRKRGPYKKRAKVEKPPKPVDPRVAALDEYTLTELRSAVRRRFAKMRTPEQKRATEEKRVATLQKKQATCEHTRRLWHVLSGEFKGKLRCATCWKILPKDFRARRVVV